MFNFSQLTHESHDTAMELVDSFNVEGLSLDFRNGEWVVTDSATGAVYSTAEYAWEVRDYLNEIDHECLCDGSDDAPHTCTFPPCVAERFSLALQSLAPRVALTWADMDAYDRKDPKRPDYAENVVAAIDEGRI